MRQTLALGLLAASARSSDASSSPSGCARSSVDHMSAIHRSLGTSFDPRSYTPPSKTVEGSSPYQLLSVDELPVRHDWRNVNGTNFVTFANAQLLPNLCGSCWGQSSLGSLNDRYKIALKALLPDIQLSVQSLVDCGTAAGTCNGGSPLLAYQFVEQSAGVPDITCSPYRGVDNSNWSTEIACTDRQCRHCDRFGTCAWVAAEDTKLRYKVEEYGAVFGKWRVWSSFPSLPPSTPTPPLLSLSNFAPSIPLFSPNHPHLLQASST